jgi:hypothetical protein
MCPPQCAFLSAVAARHVFEEDGTISRADNKDLWDPAQKTKPWGEKNKDPKRDEVSFALFIANLEVKLSHKLQNPGELAASADCCACHS